MKRVLILGGTGLISSAIVPCLVARGDDVTVFNRGTAPRPAHNGVRTLVGQRGDVEALSAAITSLQPLDAVIDMIGYSRADCDVLIKAATGRVRQVVFCSTVDVYAKPFGPLSYPVREDEPQQGLNGYGRGKVECERTLRAADAAGAFALTVLRPAHTFDDRGTLIHALGGGTAILDRLRRGMPVIVHGDGTSLWCQAHADDVGPVFAAATGNPTAYGRSYNLTGEEWVSWNQIYNTVCAANGWPAPTLIHIPTSVLTALLPDRAAIFEQNFQFSNVFCNTAAKRDLAYRFNICLAEGAARVVQWLTANNKIAEAESQPWYDEALRRWAEGVRPIGRV